MSSTKPHYLLFCDANAAAGEGALSHRGKWKFVLEDVASGERIEAADVEQGCGPDRCALISVLRGLESLEQPSRVTLVTPNRYVTRGLLYGLNEWRDNDFSWEHFGAVQPIRNADLWRRIDRTLAFHQVQCRWMSTDESTAAVESVELSNQSDSVPAESTKIIDSRSNVGATATRCNVSSSRPKNMATKELIRHQNAGANHGSQPRIFVDSAHTVSANQKDEISESLLAGAPAGPAKLNVIAQNTHKLSQGKGAESVLSNNLSRGFSFWIRPWSYSVRGMNKLCRQIWDAILALDEWLESFLRCLFLLNPRDRRSKR